MTIFIEVIAEDRRRFPELEQFNWVALEENELGFVSGQAMTDQTYIEIEQQHEREWSAEFAARDAARSAEEGH